MRILKKNRRLSVELLESRALLAVVVGADAPGFSDVNRDGVISPADALVVANALNGVAAGEFITDVNGDGETSPVDALMILNELNEVDVVEVSPHDSLMDAIGRRAATSVTVGDYDRSCVVDQTDYHLWAASFGSTTQLAADGDGNGIVDSADFVIWRDAEGSSNCVAATVWTLTNREHSDRDLHGAVNGNADLAMTGSEGTQWEVNVGEAGVTFMNVESQQYLAAGDFDAFLTPTAEARAQWNIVNNEDGSIALQNILTGRHLDGDGADNEWDVDESLDILLDDGWFIAEIDADGNEIATGTVVGTVYSDVNRDGDNLNVLVSEPGLPLRTVWADLNADGNQDVGEPSATTDSEGQFIMHAVPQGTWQIRIVPASGWTATTPIDPVVVVSANNAVIDFGQHSATNAFVTLNRAVQMVNREHGNFLNFGGTAWDVTTDANGTRLRNLATGRFLAAVDDWDLRSVVGSGSVGVNWGIVLNADSSVSFQSLNTGQYLDADSDGAVDLSQDLLLDDGWFLDDPQASAVVQGTVYSDADANGLRRRGGVFEQVLPGRNIWIDVNGNGQQDADEPAAITDENGSYRIENVPFGATQVHLVGVPGWVSTTAADPEVDFGFTAETVDFGVRNPADLYVGMGDRASYRNRETSQVLRYDGGSRWNVSTGTNGTLLQNTRTGEYLNSPAAWTLNSVASTALGPGSYWGILRNADGSLSMQNLLTGQFVDGDSDGSIDLSAALLADDGWFEFCT